jgi:hypothetical protein
MKQIRLSNEIMTQINTGKIKAVELVSYILKTVTGTSTAKELSNTGLKDISFDGEYAISGAIDTRNKTLNLIF